MKASNRSCKCLQHTGVISLAVLAGGCIAPDSDLLDVTEGCDALEAGDVDQADVDPRVREFMRATLELDRLGVETEAEVLMACSNIAIDLGAEDSWSDLEGSARIHNAEGTGACDVANAEVALLVDVAVQADANLALVITRGECHPDFQWQVECEAGCAANTECTPGTIETRCEPGSLSVQCEAECSAEGTCEGSPERPANCMGQCEAACQGECRGSCVAPDGSVTENDPNCQGKCSSGCNGLCRGQCKIEAPEGMVCGAEVSCRGGCTGEYSDPECTSEFTPPSCSIDADCYASCSAEATAHAICDPTVVEVYLDVNVTADGRLQLLVDTLEMNLPTLVVAAETQGHLALKAARRLVDAAGGLTSHAETLSGESLACAGAAIDMSIEAVLRLEAVFGASGSIVVTTTSNAY